MDRIALELSRYAAEAAYARLPSEVIGVVKRILLDTLGTTLAATTLGTGCREVLDVLRRSGGRPEATIIGTGERLPALSAAMANGALSHALNYDDVSSSGAGHMGVTSIPAALAAAEQSGGLSGRDFLAALAAGCEVMARIGAGIKAAERGYTEAKPQPTQMPGYFSCAAAAGRVLGLSPELMHHGLGLAFMQCSGGRQPVLEGRPAKAVYAAFCNHGGLLSAFLAQQGLEANCDLFTGEAGFFATYYGGRYDEAAILDGLGDRFLLLGAGFKPWPTTAVAHPFIQAALDLRTTHALSPDDIVAVHLRGGEHARTFCEPLAVRTRPATPVEAEDSVPFAVAKALVNGHLTLADLHPGPDGLGQRDVLALTGRLTYSIEGALGRAGAVQVTTRAGAVYEARVDVAPGEVGRPLTDGELAEKFRDCARHAARPIPAAAIDESINLIGRLEEVDDIQALVALLAGNAR